MPPADLTRFDFHVVRFMNSYDVEIMTDAEIGQYVLLLCKSWLLAHEATLPDDLEYLSRIAHCEALSEKVLAKFPVVETERGPMRRNPALFDEWCRASERSDTARERVQRRWGPAGDNTAVDTTVNTPVHTTAKPVLITGGYPTRTNPNRTEPNQPVEYSSGQGISKTQKPNGSDWHTLAVRHKRLFGKQAGAVHKQNYAKYCEEFGEDVVLECFDDWALDAKDWVKSADVKQPLFAFWKKLPDMAETVAGAKAVDAEEASQRAASVVQAQQAAVQREAQVVAARKADADKWDSMTKPSTENIVTLADYLEAQ